MNRWNTDRTIAGESMIQAVIADGQPLAAAALQQVLGSQFGMRAASVRPDFNEALDTIEAFQPRIAFVDRSILSDELSLDLQEIEARSPRTSVFLLVQGMDDEEVLVALQAGAYRCIDRGAPLMSVRTAIQSAITHA